MTSIKIGYSLPLSGALEAYGQAALMAHKIWEDDINARGGFLGREVELLCIDDRSNMFLVGDIYKKLIEQDKVDLIIGGYGANITASILPLVIEHKKFFISLMAKASSCDHCFSMIPSGTKPNVTLTENYFKNIAKNSSVAIIAADAEFSKNLILGARENIAKNSQRIVLEYNYALSTFDFSSLAQELSELKPDALYISAYSSDAMGIIKAINEQGLRPKKIGVSVIGPLGLRIMGSGVTEVMEKYLARTISVEADILGYYLAPQAYAQLQILEQAVKATDSLNDMKLTGYTHEAVFSTVIGDIKFDRNGECAAPQMIQTEYQILLVYDIEQAL